MIEKRLSRWYWRIFDVTDFNFRLLTEQLAGKRILIATIDTGFMEKSGRKPEGLATFHNGKTGACERGFELSSVSINDLQANTTYHLGARQTLDHPDLLWSNGTGHLIDRKYLLIKESVQFHGLS